MTETLVIAPRFCGPPDSGNGGYVCGRVARYVDGPAEITLRRPPPLATPMTVEPIDDGLVCIRNGDAVVAEGRRSPQNLPMVAPGAISIAEAITAGAGSLLRTNPEAHPFPTCFVCGPDRRPGDGLGIQVGPLQAGISPPTSGIRAARSPTRTPTSSRSSCGLRWIARAEWVRWRTPPPPTWYSCSAASRSASSGQSSQTSPTL